MKKKNPKERKHHANVAELADAADSKSAPLDEGGGSSPSVGTDKVVEVSAREMSTCALFAEAQVADFSMATPIRDRLLRELSPAALRIVDAIEGRREGCPDYALEAADQLLGWWKARLARIRRGER